MTTSHVYSSLASDPGLSELVDIFVQEMPARIETLESQARSCDWQQLKRTAHQLKGSAGSYGFQEITPCAARLESAVSSGSEEERILSSLHELLDLCRRVSPGLPQDEGCDDSSMGSDFQ